MSMNTLFATTKVVPIVTIHQLEDALPLARALMAGGVEFLEIALRTPVAMSAAQAICNECPELTVGVGTVLHVKQLEAAQQFGAAFATSPGLSQPLVEAARAMPLAYAPGVMTVTEIMRAQDLGMSSLKFFPAEAAGGVNFLNGIQPIFPDIKFMPTGGIHAQNARHYSALPNVLVLGGTWLAPSDLIAVKDWSAITQLAHAGVAILN